MLRKAILHIGPMKTGSTSIQHWLYRRGTALASEGFQVPAALGRNMSRLAGIAQSSAAGSPILPSDMARLDALRTEIESLPREIHTLIFSGEMLGQHLSEKAEIETIKRLLDEFCNRYTVILYLRRQDDLSLSRYSTALRRGEKRSRPLSNAIDYESTLNLWSEVFGRENVRARMFERSAMIDGDVVRDFAQTAGIPFEELPGGPVDQNTSLSHEAQAFLADLADRVRESSFKGTFTDILGLDEINRLLSQEFRGKGAKPPRAEALAFYGQVRASNERVRATWFPERETLFDEDFSSYPEEGSGPVAPERLLEVAMTVMTALVTSRKVAETGASSEERAAQAAVAQVRREKRQAKDKGKEGRGKPREHRANDDEDFDIL